MLMHLYNPFMLRVVQSHIYTVYVRYFWQGNHQLYGHIRCIHMALANTSMYPRTHMMKFLALARLGTGLSLVQRHI